MNELDKETFFIAEMILITTTGKSKQILNSAKRTIYNYPLHTKTSW